MFEQVEVNSERWFDLKFLKNEEFRDIKGYENIYQISNYGRVKSLKRIIDKNHIVYEKILKLNISNNGYYTIALYKNKRSKYFTVHRLLAKTFISNPQNFPVVNHIDQNKLNVIISNLEWCTYKYNSTESYRLTNRKGSMLNKKGELCPNSIKVIQYDLNNNFIKEWASMHDASRSLNISYQNIWKVCRGTRKQTGGYIWKYSEECNGNN